MEAIERARGALRARPEGAGGDSANLLSCRRQGRAGREARDGAHVRAHDVQGLAHVPPEQHARFIDRSAETRTRLPPTTSPGCPTPCRPSALDFTLKLEAERMRNLELRKSHRLGARSGEGGVAGAAREQPDYAGARQGHAPRLQVHPYRQLPIGERRCSTPSPVDDCKKFYDLSIARTTRPDRGGDTDERRSELVARVFRTARPAGPTILRKHSVRAAQKEARLKRR